ncbi:sensor histidine kinase [Streptomyces alanosinicus]|uniref:histidine kinase n=1 Tax=Streptomyces alanosinicus TaxID=68171 RepID=A0A918YJ80_9ACTN|nr:ATP-binding protein [Streptomyces alanosinicus]GHE05914.1 ATPase [Streptomyces alanosinicus]
MSHLRAPAARADRREGGRHGRPVARPAPALPEMHIRPQLMRLAVLPPLAVALSATAAVLFSIRATGARTGPMLWAVLAGAVTVTVAGILIAAVAADRAARAVSDRVDALRHIAARGEADLHALVDALRQGEPPPQPASRRRLPADADDFEVLAADLARAHDGAVTAVVRAAQLSSQAGSEQKLEVFVNLARRLQSLVHREISILDELENEIEDPDLLKGLFHVDHLATRIRRHAENLAVLGGAVSRRQWSNPVSMTEVLRSAIAEVEQYSRVKLVPPMDGELRGHAVADVIHLLAELIENASVFSAPHTQVLLRAGLVTSGLAVEVEDRGLGMPVGEQNRMNALLADPDQVNVASLLADGRIGLYVVSQLARRHGIHVRLQTNIYGGVQAVLVVPQALLGTAPGVPGAVAGAGTGGPQPQEPADTGASPQVRLQGQDPAYAPAPAPAPTPASPHGHAQGYGAGQPRGAGPVSVPAPSPGAWSGDGSPAQGVTGPGAGTPSSVYGTDAATGAVAASGSEVGAEGGQAPGTGRRRHAQRGNGRNGGESGTESGAESGGGRRGTESGESSEGGRGPDTADIPAPLPVRGARQERPTPADAVPGISAEDRAAVEAHTGILPTPRVGTVRGTMGKPQLPRRRAQQHIVPQLRGGPVPRQEDDTVPGHDPGLMAAFQRGIGLAEAQQHLESQEPDLLDATHVDSGHMDSLHMDALHMDSGHMDSPLFDSGTPDSPHMGSSHIGSAHRGSAHTDAAHLTSAYRDGTHMRGPHMPSVDHRGPDHTDPDPISQGRTHAPTSDGAHGVGRPDGSAPAG